MSVDLNARGELETLLGEQRFREAISLVRRTSRLELDTCRRFISELASGQWTWSQMALHHPTLVAALAEDPDPALIERLEPHKDRLFACLRRGRTLEALRLVRENAQVSAVSAKLFLEALRRRGLAWDEVKARYSGRPKDFWADDPAGPGLPARQPEEGLWMPPEHFDPVQFRTLVAEGQANRAVSLVRRFARCPMEAARAFVDASETASWGELGQTHGTIVAALAGDPDPALLERLEPVKTEFLAALRAGRKLTASRLAQDVGGAGMAQARALMTALQRHNLAWDEALEGYRQGRFKWPKALRPDEPAPPPAPVRKPVKPPEPAPRPVVEPRPQPAIVLDPLEVLRATHPELAALLPEGRVPDDVASLLPLLEEIARLAGAGDPQALNSARQALLILEGRGLTRQALVTRWPALEWALPPGQLSTHLGRVAAALPLLQAGRVVEAAAEAIPDPLEATLLELEQALQAGNPRQIKPLLDVVRKQVTADELKRRFPKLEAWIPPETELPATVGEATDLLSAAGRAEFERRFPKLATRLTPQKLAELKRLRPEVVGLLKRGRLQKALTLLQDQLGLSMADTKAMIELIQSMV